MTSYVGKHAQYYDTIYAHKAYAQEAAFVDDCLKKFGKGKISRLLELACGTGRHAFELEKLGYQIIATDYSPDLLAVARERAGELNSHVDFRLQDMRDLSVEAGPFDAVYCLFDSIGYVQTNDGIKRVLSGVHRHLVSEGIFFFEFWHASAMLRGYEAKRERHWELENAKLTRVANTSLDVEKQTAEVNYQFEEKSKNGKIDRFSEKQVNRYFLIQEMAMFLADARFKPLAWFGGYQTAESITPDTWHILVAAQAI